MANKDEPKGAWPAGRILSMHVYPKGTNAAIYQGDIVQMGTDGLVVVGVAGNTNLAGVAAGYQAATATEVLVYDSPDQQYYIQDDGVGGTLAATNVGNMIDFLATAGSGTLLKSRMEADTNTVTAAGGANLRILDKHPDDSWGDNVRLRVVLAEHFRNKRTPAV